jgi:hypothetical protein
MTHVQCSIPAGLLLRSGVKAGQGQVVCYELVNGAWFPVGSVVPPRPAPTPQPPQSSVQWLTCQSCRGSSVGPGQLAKAVCEVCMM